jgi:SfnB family sulfur acquisition oxidoreductase
MTQIADRRPETGSSAVARDVRPQVPVLDDASAVAEARRLAERFAEGAAARDRDRVLPYDQIDELAEAGLLALTVPAAYGGADVSASTLAEVFRLIATADPNIAQIPHSHFVYANLVRVAGTPEQQRFFFSELLEGGRFGNAQSELKTPGANVVDTRLTRDEPGWFRLNGAKGYCTGAIFATWIPVLARLDDGTPEGGEELIAFVERSADGVSVVDDWGGMGQRTTASGTVELHGVAVPAEHVVRRGKAFDGPHSYGAFAQLLHAAIEVGIARGVLDEAAEFVRTKARPHYEAQVQRAQDDPLTIQRFGELTVDVRVAEATLRAAGEAVDRALAEPNDDTAAEASLAVATAKIVAEKASLGATNGIFEVSGTRSAAASLGLDRHWRNARTHTLHDPVRWKYHHLGRWTLLGVRPPRHGHI